MAFEQPKEFNQFAITPRRWTSERLWEATKLGSPLLVLFYLLVTESRILKGLPVAPGLIGVSLFPILIILLAKFQTLAENRSKRTLRFKNNGVEISSYHRYKIRWRDVLRFQLEPTGLQGELSKFTIQYSSPTPTCWSMILPEAVQREALLSELKDRQQQEPGQFIIEVFDTPQTPLKPFKVRSAPIAPIWLYGIGVLLLFNGLPMLAVGLLEPEEFHQNEVRHDRVNPYMAQYLQHFSSREEVRAFFAIMGAVFTGSSAGCLILSSALVRRQKRAYKAEVLGNNKAG